MLKPAISFISESQNRASTLKEAIINAADGHRIVIQAQKQKQIQEKRGESKDKTTEEINIQELKKETEKLVLEDI